jgi:transposase
VALQPRLGLLPTGAEVLSDNLAMVRARGKLTFFNAAGPIYECGEDDHHGRRLACAVLSELDVVGVGVLAKALRVHRTTVFRCRKALSAEGVAALKPEVPRASPHKLKEEVLAQAQALIDGGASQHEVAAAVGVSRSAVYYALRVGRLKRSSGSRPDDQQRKTATARAIEDQQSSGGVAVKRTEERVLACLGAMTEAAPKFAAVEAVAGAGVLLALPALLDQGLQEVPGRVYDALRKGFFGLRSTFLVLAFMALLRIKSVEQLASRAPGELGLLMGLDRAPEVKTLRKKLAELGERKKGRELVAELARFWAADAPEQLGVLYVDGHVRPYHGRNDKHTLPKKRVPRMRLAMPGTVDFWVNDSRADPLFVVTAPATDGLLAMIDQHILPEMRGLVGERVFTLAFDREGWSPDRFARWYADGVHTLTYKKGVHDRWPEEEFEWTEADVDGQRVRYRLGERGVQLRPGFWVREIRRLCADGHQTAIIATQRDAPCAELAHRMFARWRQENYFRYMRHEFALDHLSTYAVEPGDKERLVPNPRRAQGRTELRALRAQLDELEREYGQKARENPERQRPTMRGFKIAHGKLSQRIRALRESCATLAKDLRAMPPKVPVASVLTDVDIVKLEEERKLITDAVKMIAYRAESALARLLAPSHARHEEEARAFTKALFQLPGDLVPDYDSSRLTVRLHGMASPRATRALRSLCAAVNQHECCYPGTELRLVFEVATLQPA